LHDFASFVFSYRSKGDGIANGPGPLFGGVPARIVIETILPTPAACCIGNLPGCSIDATVHQP